MAGQRDKEVLLSEGQSPLLLLVTPLIFHTVDMESILSSFI